MFVLMEVADCVDFHNSILDEWNENGHSIVVEETAKT